MNILFVQPANTIGGAELSLLELVKYLVDKDIRCMVCMPSSPTNALGKRYEQIGVAVHYVQLPTWPRENKLGILRSLLQKWYLRRKQGSEGKAVSKLVDIIRRERIDLVHSNTVHSRVGYLAAKRCARPHVLHLREVTGGSEQSIVELKGQHHKDQFKAKWGKHHGLMANSSYCMRMNAPYFEGAEELVVYNPIADDYFNLEKKETRIPVISLVANVTSRVKNHKLFVQIAGELIKQYGGSLEFRVFGKLPAGEDLYFTELKHLVEELGLRSSFRFMGSCSPLEVYAETDILLHTFPYESFGRIFIEAMAAKVPVIALNGGGASELIENEENGLLLEENLSPREMAKQIVACLLNEGLRQKLVDNGLAFAQNFRPNHVFKPLIGFYQNILSTK